MENIKKMDKKIVIKGDIKVETGLHIGGSSTSIHIGGIDNPVIRKPDGTPYIPGSSLKGKVRNLLEISSRSEFKTDKQGICVDPDHIIGKIFGVSADKKKGPTRLLVRDCSLSEKTVSAIKNEEPPFANLELAYTEDKTEVSLDRVTSKPPFGPRHMERVPAGAKFDFEIIINVYQQDSDNEIISLIVKGLKLLEDDYLGGSGTRGYGKVKFENLKISSNGMEDYKENRDKEFEEVEKLEELSEKV